MSSQQSSPSPSQISLANAGQVLKKKQIWCNINVNLYNKTFKCGETTAPNKKSNDKMWRFTPPEVYFVAIY